MSRHLAKIYSGFTLIDVKTHHFQRWSLTLRQSLSAATPPFLVTDMKLSSLNTQTEQDLTIIVEMLI